jgi:segregation and condensation protein A
MTVSEQEAKELALNASPVSREAAQHVLEYLSWNKALIGEDLAASERLDRYLGMVKSLREGLHVVIEDPYEKATALLFELVLSEEFNPWAIDLVRFTELYVDRIKIAGMDFPVAGRLLYMAWNILFLQSKVVLDSHQEPSPDVALSGNDGPIDEGYLADMTTAEEIDATSAILTTDAPPFQSMVRHSETRPVSLMELAKAFQEAENEARIALEAERTRQMLRVEQGKAHEVLVHGEEVPIVDLHAVWLVAQKHALGESFPMTEVLDGVDSREKVVSLFLSLLFLVRGGAVDIRQKTIGNGTLEILRLVEEMDPAKILIGETQPSGVPGRAN